MSNYDRLIRELQNKDLQTLYNAELHRRQAKVEVVQLLDDMKVKW